MVHDVMHKGAKEEGKDAATVDGHNVSVAASILSRKAWALVATFFV